jgi:hypothetical protein
MAAATTYHYKLAEHVMALIVDFAKTHYFADRKTYQAQWLDFCAEHAAVLADERARLLREQFQGDIDEKFYKTGRHYFRNKNLRNADDLHRQEKRKRLEKVPEVDGTSKNKKKSRTYIRVVPSLLEAMRVHTSANMHITAPKEGYALFAQTHALLLLEEETRLQALYMEEMGLSESTARAEIAERFKKSYKNFYNRCTTKDRKGPMYVN